MNSFVFTCGDVNGIGPEIVVKTLNAKYPFKNKKIIFICPKNVFENTVSKIKPKFSYLVVNKIPVKWNFQDVIVLNISDFKQNIGKVTQVAGKASYKSIIKACELAKNGTVDSIITAPISKLAFKKANINFPGHTELLADYFNVKKFSMMFVSNKMKAALVTIHIPIKKISAKLTRKQIRNTIDVVIDSLKNDFNLNSPRISVLGLNPHAGENGKIGTEEGEIIQPAINNHKYSVEGPFVPDAYFGNKLYKHFDCTIGMYHDQILIPFKLLNFNRGVNFTSGLPIVRTSPDHGTAFDIAGKGIANPDSMIEAFSYADKIVKNRKKKH